MGQSIMEDIHKVFSKLASDEPDMEGLLANVLNVGEISSGVLAMLDDAHANAFGAPKYVAYYKTAQLKITSKFPDELHQCHDATTFDETRRVECNSCASCKSMFLSPHLTTVFIFTSMASIEFNLCHLLATAS